MSWVDLSQPVHGGMPVYPGDDPVVISQDKFLSRDHYNHFVSCHGQHVGTHVDGPMHMTDSPATIDAFPPEQFCGDAVLFDVRGLGEVAAGVKLVGVDMPSPDHVPFPVHRRLLSAGVCIVENLRGLDRLLHKAAIRFYAFPLAIRADSSPVRAVAEVD
jgi:kynurenine formamidase